MANRQPHLGLFIIILISLGYIATEIYLPSLPSIEVYFKTDEAHVQLTLFTYLLSFSLSPLFFGPLSDKLGRLKVAKIGLCISLFATLLCTFSVHIVMLMGARFIQGLGLGALTVCARAMLADSYTGKELNRISSFLAMAIPVLVASAPVLGGLIEHFSTWRYVFLFLTFYTVFVFFTTMKIKETHPITNPHSFLKILSHYRVLFNNTYFMLYVLSMIVPMIGFMSFLTAGPFLLQNIVGLNPAEYGFLSLINGSMIIAAGFVNSRLIAYCEPEHTMYIGIGLQLSAGLLILLGLFINVPLFWVILVPSAIFIFTLPLIFANSAQRAYQHVTENRGMASAMIASAQFLGGMIGTLLFVFIKDVSVHPLGFTYIGCGSVLFVLMVMLKKVSN